MLNASLPSLTSGSQTIEVRQPGLAPEQVIGVLAEECAAAAARCEVQVADPQGALWGEETVRVGDEVELRLDDDDPWQGHIWERRWAFDARRGGVLTFVAYDKSYRLCTTSRHRAWPPGDAESVVKLLCEKADLRVECTASPSGRLAQSEHQWVQYDESDFRFLRRLAAFAGAEVWPWRGGLWFGKGPGDGTTASIDLAAAPVTELVLSEDWTRSSDGHLLPLRGAPYKGTPLLKEKEKWASLPASNPGRRTLDQLRPTTPMCWPIGLAMAAGGQELLAKALAARDAARRDAGFVSLAGPPPSGLKLGSQLAVTWAGKSLHAGEVTGIVHRQEGGVRSTTIQLGLSAADDPPPLRPATAVWPAEVVGPYEPERAKTKVRILGWPETEPIVARLLSLTATKDASTVHCPTKGELVLVGFEGGDPDAPVVLGALHDEKGPAWPDGKGLLFVLKTKGEKVCELSLPEGNLSLQLTKQDLDVKLEGEKPVSIKSKTDVKVTSDANLEWTAKQINMKKS